MANSPLSTLSNIIEPLKISPVKEDSNGPIFNRNHLYNMLKALIDSHPFAYSQWFFDPEDKTKCDASDNILIRNPRIVMRKHDKNRRITVDNSLFNGIVIDAHKGKIVAVGPRAMNYIYDDNYILKNQHKYNIYKAYDSTVVTVYYYNNRWQMSSASTHDISKATMFGTTTIEQILTSLLNDKGVKMDDLDKDYCYTFALTHPEWQPRTTVAEIHYIQGYNMNTLELLDSIPDVLAGKVDLQEKQEEVNIETLRQLREFNSGSVFSAGLILRSKDGLAVDYIVESKALSILRRCIYLPVKNSTRSLPHLALKNYLNGINKRPLMLLVPQFKNYFNTIENRVDEVITRLISKLQYPRGRYRDTKVERAANSLYSKVVQLVHPSNVNIRRIIHDIIVDAQHYNIYVDLI